MHLVGKGQLKSPPQLEVALSSHYVTVSTTIQDSLR